jgi:uncharacterized protein YggU (UPF0235/DUF167 family)
LIAISPTASGVAFFIHVTPRARRPGVGGCQADALRVRVGAPPADGAANAACVNALAKALGVRRSAVTLDPGSRFRRKRVHIDGDPERLESQLTRLASSGASA